MTSALPWHASALTHCAERLAGERLPHALLIDLPEGWGAPQLVNALAALLLNIESTPAVAEQALADLHWLAAEGAEIKVDDIRQLNRWAAHRPMVGARKVGVILDAQALNAAAANALLKTLEEPPPGTYLLLQSVQPERLLPTIRSRCQRLPFKPQEASARAWLAAQDARALALLPEVGGGPLAALELLGSGASPIADSVRALQSPERAEAELALVLAADPAAWLARWYRHLVAQMAQAGSAAPGLIAFADELLDVRRQLLSSNSANGRLLIERLAFRWQRL